MACHLNRIKVNFFLDGFFLIFCDSPFSIAAYFALFSVRQFWLTFQTHLAMTATSTNHSDCRMVAISVFISLLCCSSTCQECQVKLSNYTKHKLISIFSFGIEHNHHLFKLNAIWCKRRATNRTKKMRIDSDSSVKTGGGARKWATLIRMRIIEMLSPFMPNHVPLLSVIAFWMRQSE